MTNFLESVKPVEWSIDESNADSVREALGIRPGLRVWVGGHDLEARREVERLLVATTRPPTGPVDSAFVCPQSPEEAAYFSGKIVPRLSGAGAVWIITQKKEGALTTFSAVGVENRVV